MSKAVFVDLDFGSVARPKNIPASTAAGQPVVHEQLEALQRGLSFKDSVRVAAPGNLNLAAPGAAIDGVTMATNDRFLAPRQTNLAQGGVYIWTGAATPATRSSDMDTADSLELATVKVEEGTYAAVEYTQQAVNFTLGTTNQNWVERGAAAGPASETSAGVLEIATQGETDTGTDDARALTPAKAKAASWRVKKYATTIGDNSANSFTVTHNLGNDDVHVSVIKTTGNKDEVIVDVERTSSNAVTIKTAPTVPATNGLRVVVLG